MKRNKITSDEMWDIKAYIQEALRHTKPSSETVGRLAILETNNKKMSEDLKELKQENSTEHKEIKNIIKEFCEKMDKILEKKADKDEVDAMKKDLTDLKSWMWKAIGVVATLLFFISFFKEEILNLFSK